MKITFIYIYPYVHICVHVYIWSNEHGLSKICGADGMEKFYGIMEGRCEGGTWEISTLSKRELNVYFMTCRDDHDCVRYEKSLL